MPQAKKPAASKATPKAEPTKKSVVPDDGVVYVNSGLYTPKAEHTVKSWEEVCALLPCTLKELEEAHKNHKNQGFLGYLLGRKALVPEGTDLTSLRKPRATAKAKEEPSK